MISKKTTARHLNALWLYILAATAQANPFLTELNVPVDYAAVTADDVTAYAEFVLEQTSAELDEIRNAETPTFDSVVQAFDDTYGELSKAANNSWLMYWVSPDEATREAGIDSYRKLDALRVELYSDKALFDQVLTVSEAGGLTELQEKLVDDLLDDMRFTGAGLEADDLERFKALTDELNELQSGYSNNMNSDATVLTLNEEEARGLPETLTSRYVTEDGGYEIPVIAANRGPVLNNAASEETRKSFYTLYANRAADTNLDILDQLVARRHELAGVMGYGSYADYSLSVKMAGTPVNVWDFLDTLADMTADKARQDLSRITAYRSLNGGEASDEPLSPWDLGYYRNEILKNEYGVDAEKVREYLPLEAALAGMMQLYQRLLGLEFRAVEDPSVWHEEVEMYEVLEDGRVVGHFYLDLFPRPNKESWFYGVPLTPGNARPAGYEIPVAMLLGNFTRPSDDLPSLLSHGELNTLFHEFGHIVSSMSFNGPYAMQNGSRADFAEAMSQIFENWIWDYDILKSFALHYETGDVLPEETFRSMLEAKNLTSGIGAQSTVQRSVYDMTLYNRYDPAKPLVTDQIWRNLGDRFVYSSFVEGTHPQAAWIHINTHPTYMYGYLWSRVYAQDMFTQFEENGLRDTETGQRYRRLVLANGTQRPIDEVVEEFLGRPSNNDAYVRSLGLD